MHPGGVAGLRATYGKDTEGRPAGTAAVLLGPGAGRALGGRVARRVLGLLADAADGKGARGGEGLAGSARPLGGLG